MKRRIGIMPGGGDAPGRNAVTGAYTHPTLPPAPPRAGQADAAAGYKGRLRGRLARLAPQREQRGIRQHVPGFPFLVERHPTRLVGQARKRGPRFGEQCVAGFPRPFQDEQFPRQ